jgi:hypothetical protein
MSDRQNKVYKRVHNEVGEEDLSKRVSLKILCYTTKGEVA